MTASGIALKCTVAITLSLRDFIMRYSVHRSALLYSLQCRIAAAATTAIIVNIKHCPKVDRKVSTDPKFPSAQWNLCLKLQRVQSCDIVDFVAENTELRTCIHGLSLVSRIIAVAFIVITSAVRRLLKMMHKNLISRQHRRQTYITDYLETNEPMLLLQPA